MSTIESNFGLNTGSIEKKVEATTISVHNAVFFVFNLQGVSFTEVSGKPLMVPDPVRRPTDLTSFTFRSVVSITMFDNHAPASFLSIEFSLRVFQ